MLRSALLASGLVLSGCALGPHVTPHTAAEQASIDAAQSSLDSMRGLAARFVQVGPGSDTGAGSAWFETGHLRLQYDAPTRRIVVATRGRLTIHDDATDSTTRISLAANPLGLLLSGPVRLSGEIDVTDIQRSGAALQLSLARASNPAQGLLTLFFEVRPDGSLLLSGLEAVDAEQHRTRFHLYDQRVGQTLDEALFMPPGS
ncbi:LolA family protein [Lichenicola sp.]|uniref:LolA family protein n=1 Tax=Lichenicola sp. TaxID=2804529 RepID=UPI003B0049BE